ncbi:hypothetical protein N5E99_07335 [Pseudomonas chengduensis]|jgi:uncharacterized protein HemY|uniref:hypothetical protein n=1 Tax=Ectopseudomonas chengduensis TaxID=489632 RepID=UPI00036504CA|nr:MULTISPECIES: hypothetical protein [Pseudomonas]KQO43787.1 hypothetical protein ASF15_00610 [Pseudomonas sp. Leaf83]MBP3061488.1 hypothetical protein [Pseudomonas chengduensis]MDH0958351.1 hypothetical protein [Pseudomonas chengduensis]MDH1535565.1 hypothetical protein [Pseudomonas chengduensis]NNB74462.1 hypothetical protein [Pseudomonas chengduensis]
MEYLTFSRVLSLSCLMAAQGPVLASFEQGNRAVAYNGGILLAQFVGAFVLLTVIGAICMIVRDIRNWLCRRRERKAQSISEDSATQPLCDD